MTNTKFKIGFFAIALSASLGFVASPLETAQAQSLIEDTSYITADSDLTLEDELAIYQTIARLNHAIDAADYESYASFFAEDAVFATAFGDAIGPEQIIASLELSRPFITNKRHVASNIVINGRGDRAVVTSYLTVFERAESLTLVGTAINVDTLERRDGEWVVVRHETELDPATLQLMESMMQSQSSQ
ncbi:MAG: nuclear transport factor 2 family protein [Jaaginema sp. PMC 1079.18]|nr:nuclear transport factor 2 family protein [Jaaginema sp. PMC 1080.18]MEC4852726.1 nuclear transport factor 2 family protein [Jaaginema sp. PMC 1079.18]MEC4865636.1 nuclear transport factor 2 family protein [Jaaginema sp. PMC 1078.18]